MVTMNIPCGDRKRHHFVCRVFDTKKQMYEYYSKYAKSASIKLDTKLDFNAICMPYYKIKKVGGKNVYAKDIGEVLFHKKRIGAGIVAHEFGHAAMWHERHVNKNSQALFGSATRGIGDREERMLLILYRLVRNFTIQAYKKGVYK